MRSSVSCQQLGTATRLKLPVRGFRTITIVVTVPPCKLSVASLPEMAMSWPYMIEYALEPLVTLLNGVAERNAMLLCTTVVDPLPAVPFNTVKGNSDDAARFTKRTAAWLVPSVPEKLLSSKTTEG